MLTKEELEKLLLREDVVSFLESKSKEEIEEMLGEKAARMVGFEQKNIHHCYDLMGHTLHTIENVGLSPVNVRLSPAEISKLKVAALFHDIGKPDVASFNQKTGQQVFYGHAAKSKEIANEELKNLGYSDEEIANISFYIEHHDDFISYNTRVAEWMKTHEFVREINDTTVAEKMIENKYDFEAMGLDKDQIRYACYYLAHGKAPMFTSPSGPIEINVDMADVKSKLSSHLREYAPSKRDYEMLTDICRADASAQTELYRKDGKVLCSKRDKLRNMDAISSSIDGAYKKLEDLEKSIQLDDAVKEKLEENKTLETQVKEAKKLYEEFKEIDPKNKENLEYGNK